MSPFRAHKTCKHQSNIEESNVSISEILNGLFLSYMRETDLLCGH